MLAFCSRMVLGLLVPENFWSCFRANTREQMTRRMHLTFMRFLNVFLLSSVLVLAAGCSTPEAISYNAPMPVATPVLYVSGAPMVDTKFAAEAAGIRILETTGGANWLTVPRPLFAEEMSFEEANQMIGLGDGDYSTWPRETRVWFVIVNGRYQGTPLDPTQSNPQPVTYEGCLFVVFSARSADTIAMGDSVCPIN